MNRVKMMWLIMIASAITGVAQYVLMGVTSTNHDPTMFHYLFWWGEYILWGVRAVVESLCVGYIFMTVADKWREKITLQFFEVVILIEIAVTVGTMTAAIGSGQTIYTMLHDIGTGSYFVWALLIGAYAPLMMGGAGIAYRIQPIASSMIVIAPEQKEEADRLRDDNINLQTSVKRLQDEVKKLRESNTGGEAWAKLPDTWKAIIGPLAEEHLNGDKAAFAAALRQEVGATALSRARNQARKG